MALGASQRTVVRMIVREALGLVHVGVSAGVPLALLGGYGARAFLFGVAPNDSVHAGTRLYGPVLVALGAALFPARRASHVEPMTALRHE